MREKLGKKGSKSEKKRSDNTWQILNFALLWFKETDMASICKKMC